MRAILDVNVLIALLDHHHGDNAKAVDWMEINFEKGWATCPLTENGCLRVLSSPRYSRPMPPREILAKLAEAKRSSNHEFWPDNVSITDAAVFNPIYLQGHRQLTDVYLLALAVGHEGKLVTFDQRIQREIVVGCGAEHLVVL